MLALLALVFATVTVTSIPSPRPAGWVVDQANILETSIEDKLNTLAEGLNKTKGIEMAIVIVDDVNETPKAFATALFDHWKIGNAQTNTGVLVLLVMAKRRLEIETGKGIEAALTSQWLADMQAKSMVPKFKQKDFAGGLVAGVEAITAHLSEAPGESTSTAPPGEYRSNGEVVPQPTPAATPGAPQPINAPSPAVVTTPKDEEGGSSTVPLVGGGVGLVGVGGGAALLARRRRRQRTCDKCQPERKMFLLDEVEDDKHLDSGQQAEERIGSVDYDVLICRGCQFSRTIRHNKWFSGFSRCSQCSYKTLKSTSTTTVHATYTHGGEVQVSESCHHCSHSYSYTRYTAQLTQSDSSSSSDGSSYSSSSSGGSGFSGGSSSGGGAGSSW